ncbi:hypothetical protein AAHC03_013885 [Spirometra sp. Aus1]
MKIVAVTVLLFITGVISTEHQKNVLHSISTSLTKHFLPNIPSTCLAYLESLIKWEIIVKSEKDIEWIFAWTNSSTCKKCVSPTIAKSDVAVCMQCLRPHESHISKLPGCKECLKGITYENTACKRCLAESIYVTESVRCTVDAKVRKTMTLLKFGA